MRRPDFLGPLGERNFRLLFLARTVSYFGTAIAPVALAFAVLDDLDGSASDLGLVFAAGSVPTLIFLLVGGVWADRLPRHHVLVGTDLIMFAAQATIAALLLTDRAELWHLVVASAVRGTAHAFFFPASTGLVPQTVSPGRLQQANAVLRLSINGSHVLGAAAGGILVAVAGAGFALAFDAATFLVSAGFLVRLQIPRSLTLPARDFLAELREGWNEFRSRTWLWAIVVEFAFVNAFAGGAVVVLGAVVADRSLGGASAWGLILAAQSGGMVLGGLITLRYRPERPLLVASLAILLDVPLLALLAEAPPAVAVAGAALLTGIGIELFSVFWDTTLQQQIPAGKLSRVSSYDWLGSLALYPVGLALVGPLGETIGVGEALWSAAGVVVLGTLAVLTVADVRNLRRQEPEPAYATAS